MDAANYEVIQACSKDEIEACLQLKVEGAPPRPNDHRCFTDSG